MTAERNMSNEHCKLLCHKKHVQAALLCPQVESDFCLLDDLAGLFLFKLTPGRERESDVLGELNWL